MKHNIYCTQRMIIELYAYIVIYVNKRTYIYICIRTDVFFQSKDYSDVIRDVSTNVHRLDVFLKQNHPDSSLNSSKSAFRVWFR